MLCTTLLCTASHLGQAGLRARADLQLSARELLVLLLESCKFCERTELVPALRDVSPSTGKPRVLELLRQLGTGLSCRLTPCREHREWCWAQGMVLEQLLPCSTCCSPGCVPQGLLAQLRETHSATIPLLQYPQLSHRELGVFSPQGFIGFFSF